MTLLIEQATYTSKFQQYLRRNLAYVLTLMRQTETILSNQLCEQAMHTLSYALRVPTVWPETNALLLTMSPKMEHAGYRQEWIPYLHRGLEVAETIGERPIIAEYNLQLGLLYRLLNAFGEATNYLTTALDLFGQIDTPIDQARSLNELAWVEHLQQRNHIAHAHAENALALLPYGHIERGMSLRVQGMAAIGDNRPQDGERLHREALNIFTEAGDQRRAAWSKHNLAFALQRQQKFDEAMVYYQQAAETLEGLGDKYHLLIVQVSLGLAASENGNPEQALNFFHKAEPVARITDDKRNLADIHTNLGLTYMKLHRYQAAEQAFEQAIQLYTELDNTGWRINAMDGLATSLLAQKQYNQAKEILKTAQNMLSSNIETVLYEHLVDSLSTHLQQAQEFTHPLF